MWDLETWSPGWFQYPSGHGCPMTWMIHPGAFPRQKRKHVARPFFSGLAQSH